MQFKYQTTWNRLPAKLVKYENGLKIIFDYILRNFKNWTVAEYNADIMFSAVLGKVVGLHWKGLDVSIETTAVHSNNKITYIDIEVKKEEVVLFVYRHYANYQSAVFYDI